MNRTNRGALLAFAVLAALAAAPDTAQHPVLTEADVERLMSELSNWGRWGNDDEVGTVNLITPARKKTAAALVTEGFSVSLSRDLDTVRAIDNPAPFVDRMADAVDDQFNMDEWAIGVHGFAHTHLDALSHMFHDGRMYNGHPQSSVGAEGAGRLSVAATSTGVFGRGVLVDIPWLRDLPYLEPGTAVYPEDLDLWETRTGIRIGSGDVVFVRTGRWAVRAERGPWDIGIRAAGLHASTARWLKTRDVAILGSDGAGDVLPSGIDGMTFPLHQLLLVAMGTPMFDQCDLEAIAAAALERQRWIFLVTAAPLRATGATGSPVNIIATF